MIFTTTLFVTLIIYSLIWEWHKAKYRAKFQRNLINRLDLFVSVCDNLATEWKNESLKITCYEEIAYLRMTCFGTFATHKKWHLQFDLSNVVEQVTGSSFIRGNSMSALCYGKTREEILVEAAERAEELTRITREYRKIAISSLNRDILARLRR